MSEQNIHEVYRRLIKAIQDDPEIMNEQEFMAMVHNAVSVATDEEQIWFGTERDNLDKEMLLTQLSVYLLTDKEERTKNDIQKHSYINRHAYGFATEYAEEKTKLDLLKAYAEQQRKKIVDELANDRL